jgi:hypothetical protein
MATSLTFTGTLMASASFLVSSSQTTPLVIAQGGTNGSRIYSIAVALNSTAATLQLNLSGSFGSARISTLSVTAQSGFTAGTAIFDYFGNAVAAGVFQKQKDANGVPYFNLAPSTFLTANTTGSFLASGTTASIFVNGEFY